MALVTIVGGASSDSYATVSEFRTYWAGRLVPDADNPPDGFGDGDVEAALREACVVLEGESYFGSIVAQTQALSFPRSGIYDRDGRAVSLTTIPQALKDAQCELAYELLLDAGAFDGDALAGFSKIALGNGEVDLTLRGGAAGSGLPARVVRLLRNLRTGRQARILRA